MVIMTAKVPKRRLLLIVLLLIAAAVVLALCLRGAGGETVRIEARCGDIKIDCTNEPFRPEKTGAWQII